MTNEQKLQEIISTSGTDIKKCMKCGKCSGRCPVFHDMDIKPHQFVSMLIKGKVDALLKCKTLTTCLSCMACVERCPRGVAPASVIETVRNIAERAQNGDSIKAEDIPPVVDGFIPQQLLVSAFRKYKK